MKDGPRGGPALRSGGITASNLLPQRAGADAAAPAVLPTPFEIPEQPDHERDQEQDDGEQQHGEIVDGKR